MRIGEKQLLKSQNNEKIPDECFSNGQVGFMLDTNNPNGIPKDGHRHFIDTWTTNKQQAIVVIDCIGIAYYMDPVMIVGCEYVSKSSDSHVKNTGTWQNNHIFQYVSFIFQVKRRSQSGISISCII